MVKDIESSEIIIAIQVTFICKNKIDIFRNDRHQRSHECDIFLRRYWGGSLLLAAPYA